MDPEIHWIPPAAPKVLSDHSRIYYTMLVWAPVGRYISYNSGLGPSWPGYILQCWFGPQLASIYPTILVWAPVGHDISYNAGLGPSWPVYMQYISSYIWLYDQ